MVFSSYSFIFIFLPVVLLGYFFLSRYKDIRYQHLFLVCSSLVFYGYFNIAYLWIIISSILINYAFAKAISHFRMINNKNAQKSSLILGVIFNIALLGYYKYYDFFIENINVVFQSSFNLKHILLPLGISFFTFQQLSFLIAIFKKEEKLETFVDYSLFVSFFPQLVAGPIVLYTEMIPQFKDKTRRYVNWDNFSTGMYIFAFGLFKKIVIADTVALFADNGYAISSPGFVTAWVTSLSYTMQIYFDFSGYCDMAIGIGKMFNIDLPMNFNSPYKAQSITEFWRRWHMTLGRALKTYVYIPMGGNRKGTVRTYLNLFVTFFVSGLWHGASWTFVLWGILHGLFIVSERICKNTLTKIHKSIRIASTFLIVNFLWVFFRADSLDTSVKFIKAMFSLKEIDLLSTATLTNDGLIGFPSVIWSLYGYMTLILLLLLVFLFPNSIERTKAFKPTRLNAYTVVLLFVISTIHLSRLSVFIYFNF